MAIGDTNDVVKRLRATLAPWFADVNNSPTLTAILVGIADAFAFVYSYLQYAAQQTRILTATGGWLDLIAWDYFGARFVRRPNESDISFSPRIVQEVLRPRNTRAAIILMLQQLTGRTPLLYEPWNPNDEGSYGTGTMGYGVGLGWGSLAFRNQIFITAFQTGSGIPFVSGYGMDYGGYGIGSFAYVDMSQIVGQLTNTEIYARISQTIAAGITAWTDITQAANLSPLPGQLDFNLPQQSGWLPFA